MLPAGYSCLLGKAPRSALGVIGNSLNQVITRHLITDIERFQERLDLRVAPALCPMPVASSDFKHTEELMERGASSTRGWIEAGGLDGQVECDLHLHVHD